MKNHSRRKQGRLRARRNANHRNSIKGLWESLGFPHAFDEVYDRSIEDWMIKRISAKLIAETSPEEIGQFS